MSLAGADDFRAFLDAKKATRAGQAAAEHAEALFKTQATLLGERVQVRVQLNVLKEELRGQVGRVDPQQLELPTGSRIAVTMETDGKKYNVKVENLNPMDQHGEVSYMCAVCRKRSPKMKKCGNCKRVRYCSGTCQELHWNQGHSTECK